MNSPIFRLIQILEHVRATAEEHQNILSKNEAATRAALIDPVLRALGWDISDPQRVEVEKTEGGSQIDYALQSDGEYKFAIEAKKLEEDLTKHFVQIATYSITLKVADLFITDGIRWDHYQDISHNNQDPVRKLHLTSDALSDVAAYLVQHLDAALFVTESPVEDRLAELTRQFESLKSEVEGLKKHIEVKNIIDKSGSMPVALPSSKNWQELSKNTDYTGKRPVELRLPDGENKKVSTWKDVLVECCRFALNANPLLLKKVPMPDKIGRKIQLVQRVKPASSASYASITINGETLWIHTTYSSKMAVENCLYIIDQVPAKFKSTPLAIVLPSP